MPGIGKPEFIISDIFDSSDLLIVVECKSDINKHESLEYDRPRDYAVDGVIHYSNYLSKQFDFLGVAISGMSKSNLRIDHFL